MYMFLPAKQFCWGHWSIQVCARNPECVS